MGILLSQGLCAFLIISISMCHLIFAEEQSNATEEPDIYTKAGVCPHRFHMGCMLDVLEKSCTATQALEGCVNQGNCNQESLGEVGRILGAITKKGEEALWKCCCTKAFEYGYENCKDPNPKCKAALDEEVMKTLKEDRANIKKCMSKPSKDTCKVAMDAVKKIRDNVQRARGRLWNAEETCKILAPPEPLSDCGFHVKPEGRALERADLYCDTIIWQFKEMGASDHFMAQCPGAPKMPEKPQGAEEQEEGEEEDEKEEEGKEGETEGNEGEAEGKEGDAKEEKKMEKPKAEEGDDIYSKAAACPHRFHMGCLLDVLEKSCESTRELTKCVETGKCKNQAEFPAFVGAFDPKGHENVLRCCCNKAYSSGGYEKCKNPNKKCMSSLNKEDTEDLGEKLEVLKKCLKKPSKENCEPALKATKEVRNEIGPEVIFTFEESISDVAFELSNQNEPSLCVLLRDSLQRARGAMHSVKGCDILAPMEPLSDCGWNVKPKPRALERKDLYCDTIIWQYKEMGAADEFMSQCPGAPKREAQPEQEGEEPEEEEGDKPDEKEMPLKDEKQKHQEL